jgi:hypothetical protein
MQLKTLLDTLNLSDKDGLYFCEDLNNKKTDFLSIRVKETLLEHLNPSAFFCINNEPLILFFEEGRDLEKLEKQIWNFNQTPVIFIDESTHWTIKNGFKLLETNKRLDTLANAAHISDFEYFELITGKSWEKYRNDFEHKNRVDSYLLKNIEEVRSVLINSKLGNLNPKIANSLIGRVIFIRYLIDRNVELNKYQITQREDFYQILTKQEEAYTFFEQLKDDFNGNLFPLEYEIEGQLIQEKDKVKNYHLSIIINLLKGDKINNDSSVQASLFDIYDFSIIPIEFVSNVYEKFIGVEKQAGNGAYYTPLFLVDYIQKETVSKYFKENPYEYNCKVLDPACGSGIFLVETLRQIISQYKILNSDYNSTVEKYNRYKEKLKTLLTENIFGVDKDENAVSVAIFSLYITLLDNLEPKSIVGFQFPELIGSNFFSNDFFDEGKEFEKVLKKHYFKYILGNPPWKTKHPKEKQLFEDYIKNRKKVEKSNLEIVHREIAEAFLVRVSDFNFKETAFIVVSKILYKLEKKGIFRNYFLTNFSVRQVVELSSVRHQIFNQSNDSAIAPAVILFYNKEEDIELIRSNVVKHISLKPNIFFETFKLMVVEKYDIKKISQKYFIDEDWIWKVLVYGNVLDYYFIKRLKENYKTIGSVTKKGFIKKRGLQRTTGNKTVSVSDLIGIPFIDTQKKELKKYHIYSSKKWDEPFVAICPPKEVFKGPVLLSTKGVDSSFSMKSAISYDDAIFTDSLLALKAESITEIDTLKSISAIWNSSVTSAYITLTASSIGIEREQLHIEEKLSVPFITNDNLLIFYTEVERLSNQYFSNCMADNFIKNDIDRGIKNIDNELTTLLDISNQEKSLIDYTNTINIPLLKGSLSEKEKIISRIDYKDIFFNVYAQVFINHFGKRFNADGHYFEVEILWSKYTILMKFKIISEPSKEPNCIKWVKVEERKLIAVLTKLGFENLSNNLFLQKDIKGFEEDYFYIAKPNQYKSWHSALAYLDLSEFIEVFFKINNGENVE